MVGVTMVLDHGRVLARRLLTSSFVVLFGAGYVLGFAALRVRIVALVVRGFAAAFRQTGQIRLRGFRKQSLVVRANAVASRVPYGRPLCFRILAVAGPTVLALAASPAAFTLLQDADVGAANTKNTSSWSSVVDTALLLPTAPCRAPDIGSRVDVLHTEVFGPMSRGLRVLNLLGRRLRTAPSHGEREK